MMRFSDSRRARGRYSVARRHGGLARQRGFAIMIVLGVMMLLMVYLVAVQGAVTMTHSQGRLAAQRQEVSESLAAVVTLALASGQPTSSTVALLTPAGKPARAVFQPLPAGDAFWRTAPLLKPLPGDELLTVLLPQAPGGELRTRYVVNRQGGRPGVLALDTAEIGLAARKK